MCATAELLGCECHHSRRERILAFSSSQKSIILEGKERIEEDRLGRQGGAFVSLKWNGEEKSTLYCDDYSTHINLSSVKLKVKINLKRLLPGSNRVVEANNCCRRSTTVIDETEDRENRSDLVLQLSILAVRQQLMLRPKLKAQPSSATTWVVAWAVMTSLMTQPICSTDEPIPTSRHRHLRGQFDFDPDVFDIESSSLSLSSSSLPLSSSSTASGRIVNGNVVQDPNRFPYNVMFTDQYYRQICGGSLIGPGKIEVRRLLFYLLIFVMLSQSFPVK